MINIDHSLGINKTPKKLTQDSEIWLHNLESSVQNKNSIVINSKYFLNTDSNLIENTESGTVK